MTGLELRRIRLKMGLTQHEMGHKLGKTTFTIYCYESGRRNIPESVEKLVNYVVREEENR